MRFIFDRYYNKTRGFYPFFKYCPIIYRDYYLKKRAYDILGYNYDWQNPKTLNEKIRWLIFNEKPELKSKLTDKILVKAYAASKIGKHHSAEIYGIYDNFDDIDFSVLPSQFALKANHGWRMNILVQNKRFIYNNRKDVKNITNQWLKTDYSLFSLEPQYKNIKRKLFIESLREYKPDNIRNDIQIHCFNGEPVFIELPFRIENKRYFQFYDTNWNLLDITYENEYIPEKISKPDNINTILTYAELLSKEFSYVRCDFAVENSNIELLEMTFTPCSALIPFIKQEMDIKLGEMLTLPKKEGAIYE